MGSSSEMPSPQGANVLCFTFLAKQNTQQAAVMASDVAEGAAGGKKGPPITLKPKREVIGRTASTEKRGLDKYNAHIHRMSQELQKVDKLKLSAIATTLKLAHCQRHPASGLR